MDEVGRIREKIDLPSFISEFIPLKKAGRNFKANCPFHNEKTPSFVISPERQIWHCFGCGKGGDAFTFLMEYESLEFVEALRILAKKAGIELTESDFVKKGASKKEKIFKINSQATEYYHYILTKHKSGKNALDYLTEKRKIDPRLIETFKIGYSPSEGNALVKYFLAKKKQKPQDLVDAGIAFFRNGRTLDFFRNRIMFPIHDHRGNVVAFSGRVLEDVKESKYVNTRDTFAYHKGSTFFGLDLAKEAIKKNDRAIIVEGEFDVISCYSQGIENSIAIKGTALTEDQVALLSRFTDKVTLCLDQDEAGFEAVKRSLKALEKKGMTTTIVDLLDFKDPDEAIKQDPLTFKKLLKNEVGVYDYLISSFSEKFSSDSALGKKKIADNTLPLLANIDNEIVKEHYLKKLSNLLDTSLENLQKELEKTEKKEKIGIQIAPIEKDKRGRKEVLEEYILALLIQLDNRKESVEKVSDIFSEYEFEIPAYKKIFDILKSSITEDKSLSIVELSKRVPREIISIFDLCYLFPIPKFGDKSKYAFEIAKKAEEARELYVKNKIKEISLTLNKKEKNGEFMALQEKLSTLVKSMQNTKSRTN